MPEPNLGFFPFHTGLLQVELLYFIDQHVQFSIFSVLWRTFTAAACKRLTEICKAITQKHDAKITICT
jgi:hypothetical protein